jgi:hypothetical protein
MVIDFAEGRLALAALRVLWDGGFDAVYLPDRLVAASPDLLATLLVVHQIEVPDAQFGRAFEALDRHGLQPTKKPAPLG